jgi:hypothetical protein
MFILIVCWFQDFIYEQYTKKKHKKIIITKIKKNKKNTKIKKGEYVPFNMLKTTINTIKIRTNSCKNKHKRRGEEKMKWGTKKKWTTEGGGWVLYNNFTDDFTERN